MTLTLPHDIESAGPLVAGFYDYLVEEKGQSPRMAEMLALRQAPRVMTDDVMMSGIGTLADQFKNDPQGLEHVTQAAIKRGYRPKPTDFYCASAAACPGDPQAFLNHGQGRGHLRKLYERRGWTGRGIVDVEGREPERDPYEAKTRLSEGIVNKVRKRMIRANPDLMHADQRELREQIVHEHGASTGLPV